MPTYVYRSSSSDLFPGPRDPTGHCATCCDDFEVEQGIKEEPLIKCPTCGRSVYRIISGSSFVLKGGGWYKDLYSSTKGSSNA